MTKLIKGLIFVGFISGLAYFVLTHPAVQKREKLNRTVQELEAQNEALEDENEELAEKIRSLRENPRAVAQRARDMSGLVRAGEIVYHFETDDKAPKVKVDIQVGIDEIEVAEQPLEISQLGAKLTEFEKTLPAIDLTVRFDSDVGEIRRQKVRDRIRQSKIGDVTFREN